jgi:tRNA A37 threonylcarbamoyladenosine dehydratase
MKWNKTIEWNLYHFNGGISLREQFSRIERLLGTEAMEKLYHSRVAVFGIGGVGGHAVEALVRSGVGSIDIIDSDDVAVSNINRQLIATHSTVGRKKVDVMKEHLLDINPSANIETYACFFLPETEEQFDFTKYDYVIDAVDTVTAKLALVEACEKAGTPIISSMGAGNKLDPTAFEVTDIYKTSVCPLAKVMRRELKKRNIKKLKVVYSKEEAMIPIDIEGVEEDEVRTRRQTPGSVAFVPSVAGLIMAGEVIKDLTAAN